MPIAPGVAADELAHSIDGPITLSVAAGSTTLDIRVPLNDPAPAQKLIDQCDKLGPLGKLGATVANGRARVPLPQIQMTVEAWIDGKRCASARSKPSRRRSTRRCRRSARSSQAASGSSRCSVAARCSRR